MKHQHALSADAPSRDKSSTDCTSVNDELSHDSPTIVVHRTSKHLKREPKN